MSLKSQKYQSQNPFFISANGDIYVTVQYNNEQE